MFGLLKALTNPKKVVRSAEDAKDYVGDVVMDRSARETHPRELKKKIGRVAEDVADEYRDLWRRRK